MAHTRRSTPSQSALPPHSDDDWDLRASQYASAQNVVDQAWRADLKDIVLPHITLSLHRVRRARVLHGWLSHLGTVVALVAWGSLTLVFVETAFAADAGNAIRQVVPAAVLALPAWAFLGLQRLVSAWLSCRERELREQEVVYLSCVGALHQNSSDMFQQVLDAMIAPPEQRARMRSAKAPHEPTI